MQNFPEMWRLVLSQEEEARNDPALRAEKAEWLECMPAVRWVSRLPSRVMEQFRVGRNEYDYGLLVEADAARQLGLRRTDHVELVCGGDYLTTVWKRTTGAPSGGTRWKRCTPRSCGEASARWATPSAASWPAGSSQTAASSTTT